MENGTRRRRLVVGLGAITAGAVLAFLPLVRAEAVTSFSRVSGADRYGTAAALSAQSFSPGVAVVYVATGADFPDALAAAPVAAKGGGPVLLTQANVIPTATATELGRLKPLKIIVLGGTSSVSQGVMDGLKPYTTGTVTRIQGADRYATAAALSAATYAAGVNTVYVASGQTFPDALSGGPAAATSASGGGPLLLVQSGTIPTSTATELQRLGAQKVIVLGGSSSVSDGVVTALDPYSVDQVTRRFGTDRYLTSVAISSASFTSASKVYLATGSDFPDALAGGPVAGILHGPVLLTPKDCITPEVNAEITRLNPDSVYVLGGTSSVSDAVVSRTVCVATTTTSTSTTTRTPARQRGRLPARPVGATGRHERRHAHDMPDGGLHGRPLQPQSEVAPTSCA